MRGATGLLTGAGNPSASINLVRKHANATDLTGFVSVGGGSWDTWDATVDLAGRLTTSGRVRGRAVVSYEDGDSHTDLLGNEKLVYYAVVDADLGDHTLLRIGGSHQDNDPRASTWGGLPGTPTVGEPTGLATRPSALNGRAGRRPTITHS